jgi:quinoprotein glucose dehydrogenase
MGFGKRRKNGRLAMKRMKLLQAGIAVVGMGVVFAQHRWGNAQAAAASQKVGVRQDWPVYGGDLQQDRYSPLTEINRSNVKQLKVAWRFKAGDSGGLQTNPLVIGRRMFVYTATQQVVALDGATGERLWVFDSGTPGLQPARGFSYWSDGAHGILFAAQRSYVYALDPETGKPLTSFGEGGRIDLRKDLGATETENSFAATTTPGVIYKDMIILGFRLPETKPALHGDIRAYDVHTGKLRWSFHTIPHPGEAGYESWPADAWKQTGAANNWTGMSVDVKRGIVYAPTGSAVDDFYGGDRIGDDHFADTLLALDAATGKRLWDFQGVHHDIWDRDFPSPPTLVTVRSGGRQVDAVAQATKQGFLYLFDRVTGKPLFPIDEKPFAASTVPGEKTSATQPVPRVPEPYARQRLTEEMLTARTPEAHAYALEKFRSFRSDGQFVPFSVEKQTVVFPGFDGGAEWGGSAVDVRTGVIYINANDIPWTGGLTEAKAGGGPGAEIFQKQCAVCHGTDRRGSPGFPALVDVSRRLSDAEIAATVQNGKGRMPAFAAVRGEQMDSLLKFLKAAEIAPASGSETGSSARGDKQETGTQAAASRYLFTGYRKFYDQDGYPAVVPPWGTLNAIDLNTGKYLWKIPLGNYPELKAAGVPETGTENYGGPVVTAGGVLFIAATIYDHTIRAFDSSTGALLWSAELPYAGNATPATYMIDGRQYVVIATSNARNPKGKQGAEYVAFSLP